MTLYEKLLSRANNEGIRVKEIDLGTEEECGYYCNSKILINSRMSDKQKYIVLAEELGHHYTTFGDITNQCNIRNRKKELIARRWGYEHTVSLIGLINSFEHGCKNKYEISEFLGVTVEYLDECIESYKKKYGVSYFLDQYCIIFEPNLSIGKLTNSAIYKEDYNER